MVDQNPDPFEFDRLKDEVKNLSREVEELKDSAKEESLDDSGLTHDTPPFQSWGRAPVVHYHGDLNASAKTFNGNVTPTIDDYAALRKAFEAYTLSAYTSGIDVQHGDTIVGTIGDSGETRVYCLVTFLDTAGLQSQAGYQVDGGLPYKGQAFWSYHLWSSSAGEGSDCECASFPLAGSSSKATGDCYSFEVLTDLGTQSGGSGVAINLVPEKRVVKVDKCGNIVEIGAPTDDTPIPIPCCEGGEPLPPCATADPTLNGYEWPAQLTVETDDLPGCTTDSGIPNTLVLDPIGLCRYVDASLTNSFIVAPDPANDRWRIPSTGRDWRSGGEVLVKAGRGSPKGEYTAPGQGACTGETLKITIS